ncbi:cytochrome P450 2J3-like [Saccostrea echinata]|uniref:cytochrome P450 2J3-like n=1 Tax=Saccostrea echinata TaxID=191078 RepID=UPI002A7ED8B3|nr:cytochrome P450 2J3-like [Saccostrea echinata]
MSFLGEVFTFTNVLLLLLLVLLLILWKRSQIPKDLPPGPKGIPLLGVVNINPQKMFEQFREFRKEYGDVFGFYIGRSYSVIINGEETIRDVFVKKGDLYSDRPDYILTTEFGGNQGILSNSGRSWKEQRTFALATLRDFGVGKRSLEGRILEEVEVFLDAVKEQGGQAFDVKPFIHVSVSNVLCSILFGKRFGHDDAMFLELVKLLNDCLTGAALISLIEYFPFLRYLPGDLMGLKMLKRNTAKLEAFYDKVIAEHKSKWMEGKKDDFIDCYLTEIHRRRNNSDSVFNEKELSRVLSDMFNAGTDTTATVIRWIIAYLINYPDVQTKLRREIYDNLGKDRLPSLDDRSNLPYTLAVINEVLRIGIPSFGVPHTAAQDTYINGYRIPKGCSMLLNIDSVNFDPKMFPNPDDFNPDRFIKEDGKFNDNLKILTFSVGRRVCLGESLARFEIFLFIASIVQKFELLQDGPLPPSTTPVLGITFSPKDFKFHAKLIDS